MVRIDGTTNDRTISVSSSRPMHTVDPSWPMVRRSLASMANRRENLLRNSFGDGQVGWINGSDAGEPAVAALLRPSTFDGPVCYPTGSELLNHHEIAETLTQELGRPITFEPISPDQWRDELVRVAEDHPDGVVSPAMAGHIASVGAAVAARGAPPADCTQLSRLINRTPVSLREFVRANRAVL
jgi:uncharacterized protein YbjT (DUF2867 family)